MVKQRLRIRFRKQADLKWIGHRDLARAFERLFRRAGLPLAMSEGFHPKPRMSFPSALAVGIGGDDEVMEVVLAELVDPASVHSSLAADAPEGLVLTDVAQVEPGKKAQLAAVTYQARIPEDRRSEVDHAIQRLMARSTCPVQRDGRSEPIDARAQLLELKLTGGVLEMRLAATRTASARPQEILDALGLADLAGQGGVLTRSAVEVTP